MFPTSTLPALLSLLSTMLSRLSSSYQFPQGCFHATMFDVSRCILCWLELLMRFSSFAYSSAWYTLLLFFDKLPFSLQNSFCLHLPWEDFCQYWLPSLQSHNLSLLFISLFASFPLSYDVSRADTHCCNSRVQHGTYHWMGLIIFKKGGKIGGKEEAWIFVVLMEIEDGSFIHSFIQLFNQRLLSTYHILGAGISLVDKTDS